jgi:hypothetical protein
VLRNHILGSQWQVDVLYLVIKGERFSRLPLSAVTIRILASGGFILRLSFIVLATTIATGSQVVLTDGLDASLRNDHAANTIF